MNIIEKHLRAQNEKLRAENLELRQQINTYAQAEKLLKIKEDNYNKQIETMQQLEIQWKAAIEEHAQARVLYNQNIQKAGELVMKLEKKLREAERK